MFPFSSRVGDALRFHVRTVSLYYKFPSFPPPNSSPPRVARLLTRRRLLRISQSIEKQTNSRHQTGRKKKVKRNKGVSRSRTKKNQTGASEKWTQSVTKNFKELFSHQISERKKKTIVAHISSLQKRAPVFILFLPPYSMGKIFDRRE